MRRPILDTALFGLFVKAATVCECGEDLAPNAPPDVVADLTSRVAD